MRYDTKHLSFLNPHIMICDRCGEKQFDHKHFLKITTESSEGYGHVSYEICPKCEKAFEEWIAEKEFVKEKIK